MTDLVGESGEGGAGSGELGGLRTPRLRLRAKRDEWYPGAVTRWLLLAFVLFLRQPDSVLNAQFWAEDATVFFKDAYSDPTIRTVIKPYAGYMHIVPRAVMWAAVRTTRAERLPLVCNVAAILIAAGCLSIFSATRFRCVVRSDLIRLGACVLAAACHPGTEILSSLTNVQWYMTVGSLVLLACPWRFGPAMIAAVVYQLIAGMNCPLNLWLTPLALLLVMMDRRRRGMSVALLLGVVLHGVLVLTLVGMGERRAVYLSPGHLVEVAGLCLRDVTLYSAFGHPVARWLVQSKTLMSWIDFAVVLGVVPLLLWRWRFRRSLRIVLAGMAVSVICMVGRATVSAPDDPKSPTTFFAEPNALSTRYYVLSYCIAVLAMACAADAALRARRAGIRMSTARCVLTLVICAALCNVIGSLRNWPHPDLHWRHEVKAARAAGWHYSIPVNPGWRLVLEGPSPVVR